MLCQEFENVENGKSQRFSHQLAALNVEHFLLNSNIMTRN